MAEPAFNIEYIERLFDPGATKGAGKAQRQLICSKQETSAPLTPTTRLK